MKSIAVPIALSFLLLSCHKTQTLQNAPIPSPKKAIEHHETPVTELPPKATVKNEKETEKSQVVQSGLCKSFHDEGILVPDVLIKPLLTASQTAVLIPENLHNCLGKNASESSLRFAGFNFSEAQPYSFPLEPRFKINAAVEKVKLDDVLNNPQKFSKLGIEKKEDALSFYSKYYGSESIKSDWVFIEVSLLDRNLNSAIFFAPQTHPYAKTVTREQVQSLISQGADILDVRSTADFKRDHILQAKNSPVTIEKIEKQILSAQDQKSQGFVIYPGVIPADRSKKIVVMNQNPLSLSAYNTITLLKSDGYNELYFFWEGMDTWKGSSLVTPTSLNQVVMINYNDFTERFRAPGAVILDIRSAKKYKEHPFPKAVNAPFKEEKNEFKQPRYRAESLTYNAVAKNEKGFDGTPPNSIHDAKKIVLVGDHRYDWRPYKAALLLAKETSAVIEIYREGYKGWKFFSSFDKGQKKYKTKKPKIRNLDQPKIAAKPRKTPVRLVRSDGTPYPKAQVIKGTKGTTKK